ASYRPFQKSWLYTDKMFVEAPSLTMQFFPEGKTNLVIVVPAPSDRHNPGVYITDSIPDFHLEGVGVQCFPLYNFIEKQTDSLFDTVSDSQYAVSQEACAQFSKHYGFPIDGEMIFYYTFGVLSSPEYQETFRADLKKQLPHIPMASDFAAFERAGRDLAKLVLGYESLPEYQLEIESKGTSDFQVDKMSIEKTGELLSLKYNATTKFVGIPDEAFSYKVFGRSPLEWVVARYQKKTDKNNGILQDPNLWSSEAGDEKYIMSLVRKSITLSIEANAVVSSLPKLQN
ncbi:MAG: hypothetical protein RIS55_409, partial [Actinomycetota bacterium]